MRRNIAIKVLVKNRYLISIIAILTLIAYSIGCAADSGTVTDYASLIDNLRKAGAVVEPRGEVAPDFLSAKRRVITVNNSNVQVWEYENVSMAETEAALVSPDGSSVRRPGVITGVDYWISGVDWIAPPHFYKAGKLIVLYVGESEAVIDALESVLGPQFAGH